MRFLKGRVHPSTRTVPTYPFLYTEFHRSRLAMRKEKRLVVSRLSFCTGAAVVVSCEDTTSWRQQAHLSVTFCWWNVVPFPLGATR